MLCAINVPKGKDAHLFTEVQKKQGGNRKV